MAQELEDKYDLLKDKLYTAALMKELGEKEWALLSEKERQKKYKYSDIEIATII